MINKEKVKLSIRKGIYYYPNGDKYEGDWKDDLRHGNGNRE